MRWNGKNPKRGQSIVELAIALPMLLLLLLATVDASRVLVEYIQMRNATVEGATFGSRHPFDGTGIANAAQQHGLPDGVTMSSTTAGDCATPRGQGTVVVSATKTFTPIYVATLERIAGDISWSFDVSARSTMRCLT